MLYTAVILYSNDPPLLFVLKHYFVYHLFSDSSPKNFNSSFIKSHHLLHIIHIFPNPFKTQNKDIFNEILTDFCHFIESPFHQKCQALENSYRHCKRNEFKRFNLGHLIASYEEQIKFIELLFKNKH